MSISEKTASGPDEDRAWEYAVWDTAPYPVLLADAAGTIIQCNAAAARLLAGAAPGTPLDRVAPPWLTGAHRALTAPARHTSASPCPPGTAEGDVGERSFAAHGTRRPDGGVVWWLVETTALRGAEEALRGERERTALLEQVSSALSASLNAERCTEVAATLAVTHLADAALVVTPDAGRRLPVTSCVPGRAVSRTLVRAEAASLPGLSEALRGFPPVPSRWIDPASLPAWAVPDDFDGPPGSVVVTPLPGHGVPAGALVLLRRSGHAAFTETEEVFARLFAARAGAALSAARMYAEQSAITTTLMRDLLPPALSHHDGVEFAGGYRAARDTGRVGGDFYDVHPGAGEGRETLAVLGDVCGKGLDAAVLTGKIRNTLQALLPLAADHARMLDLLNGALLTSHHTRFATLALASVARRDDRVHLRLTSAGHPVPLIVRGDGRVEEADTRGTLVGALPEVAVTTAEVVLEPGETCLLHTDGITEARGGPLGNELFGDARLREALAECAGMPAEAVVERVQMLAAQWVGPRRHDDMAVLAVSAPRHRPTAVDPVKSEEPA